MHKNAIKIVWGVKNCAPFTKNMALFGGKKFVRLFVRFLAELGAPLSSELLTTLSQSQALSKSSKIVASNFQVGFFFLVFHY